MIGFLAEFVVRHAKQFGGELEQWRRHLMLASEFSRDMMLEGKPEKAVKDQVVVPTVINDEKFYGMHRHFTAAGSVLLFGGGMKRGYVHGVTADERPCRTIKDPVTITDLHATILHQLGIDHLKLTSRHLGRDFRLTDVYGEVVKEILA